MSHKIVIGLGFGDEGKGLVTDYLCSQNPESLVVRFAGGHQVGHTVIKDGVRHVFSNFGSGTLRSVPTYWAKYCTVDPVGIMNELAVLKEKGINNPVLYIDSDCPITTPYDKLANVINESSNRHGSVGVGFGATINREEKFYSLKFRDLFYPAVLRQKLKAIKEFYSDTCEPDQSSRNHFIFCCEQVVDEMHVLRTDGFPLQFGLADYVFEGNQGLLLDQHFGFFPNVTRSNTGTKNAVELLNVDRGLPYMKVYLVTRAYQTRHGNGFMTNENLGHSIKENLIETNVEHPYQGRFRRSILDVSLLEYAIDCDDYIKQSEKNLVITCLDHVVDGYKYTYCGELRECDSENEFVRQIAGILGIENVFISNSDESKNLRRFEYVV